MKRVKQSFSTRMLMLALFLGVLAYFGVQAVRYIDDPLTTTLASCGRSVFWRMRAAAFCG